MEGLIKMTKESIKVELLHRLLHVENIPLQFNWNGLKVVVTPKNTSKLYEEFPVYVNNIHQRKLFGTSLHDKWFNKERATSNYGQDWRYLLGLDIAPSIPYPPHNKLQNIFIGIPAKSEGEKHYYIDVLTKRHGKLVSQAIPIILNNGIFVLFTDGTKIKIND